MRAVQLPVGLWLNGARHREAVVCGLTGAEEETLGDAARWSSPAARVSALLAATVTQLGTLSPLTLDQARALTVLDRDILLLTLRQLLFGDRIQVTLSCPHCTNKIDLDFCLSDLPIPERQDQAPQWPFVREGLEIQCRLPNGGDQEAVARLAQAEPERAAQMILERCIETAPPAQWRPSQWLELRGELAQRDPQLDNELGVHCPECDHSFSAYFDIQDFLLRELAAARGQLYREVHTLAWYYHWSEAEILSLPFGKRRFYLDLLADALTESEVT